MDFLHFRTDLETSIQEQGGRRIFVVKDPTTGTCYQFPEAAYQILLRFDGSAETHEILAGFVDGRSDRENVEAALQDLIKQAIARQLLVTADYQVAPLIDPTDPTAEDVTPIKPALTTGMFLRLLEIPIGPRLRAGVAVLGLLFHPLLLVPTLGLTLFAAYLLFSDGYRFVNMAQVLAVFSYWPLALAILLITNIWHELGHFSAAERFKARTESIGAGLYLFAFPVMFVEIKDYFMVSKLRHRLAIALGGIYFDAIIWSLIVLVWYNTPNFTAINQIAFTLILFIGSRIAFNIVPVLRLDGYWVLSEWIGIRNLRDKAFIYSLSLLPGLKQAWHPRWRVSGKEHIGLPIFALCSIVMTVSMLVSVIAFARRSTSMWVAPPWDILPALAIGIAVTFLAVRGLYRFVVRLRKSSLIETAAT
ncbi:MAG: M50 family metallopeptidase [Rhodocyclaceae bacterium]|nr:M50 family metallopeptidase [Rhodocyclaceae bacterium]